MDNVDKSPQMFELVANVSVGVGVTKAMFLTCICVYLFLDLRIFRP